ncbi:MAG: amino acid ABC transporter substrate-binding protein [Treponema sp.]|jgi:polar amino acid transport system substrate-binding protein|nr:amino acid ABC transporter substrate-binding protein [Treponema sp.]
MKKVFIALCMLAVAGALFAGGKKETNANADDSLQNILNKKKLVLGLDDSFPPMGFRNEANEIVGYDIDLAKEVARRMGVGLVTQPIDWNAKEQELNSGEIDCIWNGFTITEERKRNLRFTPPYLKNAQVVVVQGRQAYQKLTDLAGKTVGVQSGSSAQDALDGDADFKASLKGIVEFKENLTALMDLETGGIDAVVMDLLVANDNINRSGKDFRVLGESLAPEEYGIGFRKNDKALADKVWETLLAMAKDGTVDEIAVKWLGADISVIGR